MVGANNVQLRIFFEHAFAEFFSAFWTAAEEVVREFGGAGGEEFSQEGGAVDAVLEGGALAVQAPDKGHSIGDEEVDAGCGGGECWVVTPHGDDVGIGKIDGVGAGLTAAGEEVCAKGLVIGAGKVGGEDAAGGGHAGKNGKKWRVMRRWLLACSGVSVSAGSWYQHFDACLSTLFEKIMDSKTIGEVGLSAARRDFTLSGFGGSARWL